VFTYTFDIVILSLFTCRIIKGSLNHIALETSRCLDPRLTMLTNARRRNVDHSRRCKPLRAIDDE